MRITILNGSLKNNHSAFDNRLNAFCDLLSQKSELNYFDLKDMSIKQCTGCFGCWVKLPGKCVIKDDMDVILKSVINSDLVVFASPLIMGMPTGLLKRVQDRFIPLIHPYITLVDGECHHRKRYEKYPYIGVIYEQETEDTQEDLELCHEIYKRFAINFHSHVQFFSSIDEIKAGDVL